ncbi:conserved hypothetical protein [Paenibacillus curdlanolyticus YK9]|uniref:Uncharacterized protein n=1 Tax=Paenibacillus curdlanolyticus YK9 TaxID=717606 RepID=E0I659_9BACL|nr:hypothetical protein [Paenibacillus curdlanolyticus]EFM12451.1 conserved hypothetical protein [Paenibacillus curdlanolyticus YK9]
MLTFEQKLEIIQSFPQLERKDVSLGRINFQYEESAVERKNVVYHLHPNGNGYVYAGLLADVAKDAKGLVNIRDLDEQTLRNLLERSIESMTGSGEPAEEESNNQPGQSAPQAEDQVWKDKQGNVLLLRYEDDADLWYIWALDALDCAFETLEESVEYLTEEGFKRAK